MAESTSVDRSTLMASVMPPNEPRVGEAIAASSANSSYGNSPMFVSAVLNQWMTPSMDDEHSSQPSAR